MTVAEFEAHLKWKREKLFNLSECKGHNGKSTILGQQAAMKGGLPPMIAMHTRRAMQRGAGRKWNTVK